MTPASCAGPLPRHASSPSSGSLPSSPMKKGEDRPRGCLRASAQRLHLSGGNPNLRQRLTQRCDLLYATPPPMRPRSMLFRLPDVAVGPGNDPEQSFGLPQRVMSILAFSKRLHQIARKIPPPWTMTQSKQRTSRKWKTELQSAAVAGQTSD